MSWFGETTDQPLFEAGHWGYLYGTLILAVPLVLLVFTQIKAMRFNVWLYWATIIASTTAGTTMADFATRDLGIGYPGGSLLLLAAVLLRFTNVAVVFAVAAAASAVVRTATRTPLATSLCAIGM